MIEIKNNLTRISLWNNGKRFAKIESKKLWLFKAKQRIMENNKI